VFHPKYLSLHTLAWLLERVPLLNVFPLLSICGFLVESYLSTLVLLQSCWSLLFCLTLLPTLNLKSESLYVHTNRLNHYNPPLVTAQNQFPDPGRSRKGKRKWTTVLSF
jgi:hypothetical protein